VSEVEALLEVEMQRHEEAGMRWKEEQQISSEAEV
jgi:hypothetical protein